MYNIDILKGRRKRHKPQAKEKRQQVRPNCKNRTCHRNTQLNNRDYIAD